MMEQPWVNRVPASAQERLTTGAWGQGSVRDPVVLVTLVLLVALVSFGLTLMVRSGQMLSTVWLGPGLMLAGHYAIGREWRWRVLAASVLAHALGGVAGGLPPPGAIAAASMCGAEAAVGAALLRIVAPEGLDLTRARASLALGAVALLAAPSVGLVIRAVLLAVVPGIVDSAFRDALLPGPPFDNGLIARWVLPNALGIVLVAPLGLSLCHEGVASLRRLAMRQRLFGHGLVLLATTLVFAGEGRSYLSFLWPALVWIGMKLGIRDLAGATVVSLVVASVSAAGGQGPVDVVDVAPHWRPLYLEVTFLCSYGWILPVAAALESRGKLEGALKQALESSSQILRNLHEVVFRIDGEGCWTFLNPAWEEVTGYRIDDSLGRDAFELIGFEDRDEAHARFRLLRDGLLDEVQFQRRFHRRDGTSGDLAISLRAVRTPDGRFRGALGSLRDVTEQLRHVQALEASEERFRRLCDASPVGIVRFEHAGRVAYANHRFSRIVGHGIEDLIGHGWSDVFGTGLAHVWGELSDALVQPSSVFERELCVPWQRDGSPARWLAVTVAGEFDATGRLRGHIAAVTDITERKAAELALERKSRELRLLAENINDMILRIDCDGYCLYTTPSVREIMGLEPAATVGQKLMQRIHSDDVERVRGSFARLARGEFDHMTLTYRACPVGRDDAPIWLEANCRLLRDAAGEPEEVIAAVRDVTERKRLEFDLIEARARAEQATAARSQFLANLSHEIRTPMNGVIGLADLLLENGADRGGLDRESRHYVELIAQSGQTMMRLLNDILDIAKIDAGRMQIAAEAFDLRECLESSLSLMTASAVGKGLDLTLDVAPEVPARIVGDSLRLRQVLANLLGNAVKFTHTGHVALRVRCEGATLVMAVEDSGIGISAEQQARIFEDFHQVPGTSARGYGGTGLGLAISRRLAEAMGGTLALTSCAGQGTTLWLRLPLVVPAASVVMPTAAAVAPTCAVRGLHLLVAEDNRTNRMILTAMLERLGHRVGIAEDGAGVLARVESAEAAGDPFDAVLMDVQMPGMDGIEATRRLRGAGHDPARLPIVAVTANGYPEDVEACIGAGMQGHLVKPVRLGDLSEQLDRLTRGGSAGLDEIDPGGSDRTAQIG